LKDTANQILAALKAAIARLPEAAREPLFHAAAPGVTDPKEAALRTATAMAEPSWARTALRELPIRSRAALRILIRVPHPIPWAELESLVAILPDTDDRSPLELLVRRGLVAIWVERHFNRFEERRIAPLDPLRERLSVLLQEEAPAETIAVNEDEERFARARFDLQMGVLAAVVEQTRPRVTRYTELHRSDTKVIVEQVTSLIGGADEALRSLDRLVRHRLFFAEDGRLRLDTHELPRWGSALGHVLLTRLEERQSSSILRVALGTLLIDPGWVPESRLFEAGAIAALGSFDNHCVRRLREEIGVLSGLPGVQRKSAHNTIFWRLVEPARQVLAGEELPPARATGLLVQPNLQVVASPGCAFEVAARLGRIAKLVSADQVAVFALDEASIRRAAAEGASGSEMLEMLERSSSHGVPSTVARAISDWSRARGRARIAVGTVLHTDLPIEEVRRIVGPRAIVKKLADGWLQTDAVSAMTIMTALRKAGIACLPFDGETLREAGDEDSWAETPERDEEKAPAHFADMLRADVQRAMRVRHED
jgi:hypothetical protein